MSGSQIREESEVVARGYQTGRLESLEEISEMLKRECPDSQVKAKLMQEVLEKYREVQELRLKQKQKQAGSTSELRRTKTKGKSARMEEEHGSGDRTYIPEIRKLIEIAATNDKGRGFLAMSPETAGPTTKKKKKGKSGSGHRLKSVPQI